MKNFAFTVLFFMFAAAAYGQTVPTGFDLSNYGVRLEPDKRVIIVLATLEAARTTNEAGESVPVLKTKLTPEGDKFREQLASDLALLNEDLRQRISTFVIQHKRRYSNLSDEEIVAPFISMAYALSPPPDLADPVVTSDLPGSILDVLDFAPLVRDFYRRSSIAGNINDYVKAYKAAAGRGLADSANDMVTDLLGYLHTRPQLSYEEKVKVETAKTGSKNTTLRQTERRSRERRFYIVPELLAPVGYVHFLNVKDDYYVVLPPETDLAFSEVRRGFLQFVIDPIVLKNSREIDLIRDGVKKLIDERRKTVPNTSPDVYLTISRSLVAAIDAKQLETVKDRIATERSRERIKQMTTDADRRAVSAELEKYKQEQANETILNLSEDYDKGALLVFYFADQLKGVEDSGFDIASSMREMLLSLDPAKEANRYSEYADARKRALAAREERKKNPGIAAVVENPVTGSLLEIQKVIDAKNYTKAFADLNQLAAKHGDDARIYYNLGRVASLQAQAITDADEQKAKLLEAKSAYEKVVKISQVQAADPAQRQRVDVALLSLSYVALAKIYEFYDDKTYAMGIYDAAIKLGNVPGGAHGEAIAAKQRLLKGQ